jgi:uncharacterized protein involved in exopolysaccharide biosynthesis
VNDSTQPLPQPEPRARPALGLKPAAPTPPSPEQATFVDYLYGAVRRRRWIGLNMLLVAVVAAVTALLLPHWYRATGSFLPASDERSSFSITAFLRDVAIPGGGLSDAMQAGDLSAALLASRRITGTLVEEFDLVRRYGARDIEMAMGMLADHTDVFVGQEGLVTVSIEDRDPETAERLVNRSFELLDEFNAHQHMTEGQRTRIFVERELERAESELKVAEEALERYQTDTKLVPLSSEIESAVSSSAGLLARKLELEIELEMKESVLREGNAELVELRRELATIDRMLGELPQLTLELARLVRDVRVRETVYGFLRTEYEQAKIQEERDTSSITVVDQAEKPLRRHRPRRTRIVLTAVGVAGVVSLLGAFVATWFEFLPAGDRRRETLNALNRDLRGLLRPRRRRDR